MAGISGLSARNQGAGQDPGAVGSAQTWESEAGLLGCGCKSADACDSEASRVRFDPPSSCGVGHSAFPNRLALAETHQKVTHWVRPRHAIPAQIALNCLPPRWYVATQRKAAPHFASTWDSGRNPLAPPSWQVRLRPRTLNAIPSTSGGGSLRKTNYHVDRTAGITPALYIRGNGHTHFGVGFCLYLPNAD